MDKNNRGRLSIILLCGAVICFSIVQIMNVTEKNTTEKKENVKILALAANIFQLKYQRYPESLAELLKDQQWDSQETYKEGYSYSLTSEGKDCIVKATLLFGGEVSSICSESSTE